MGSCSAPRRAASETSARILNSSVSAALRATGGHIPNKIRGAPVPPLGTHRSVQGAEIGGCTPSLRACFTSASSKVAKRSALPLSARWSDLRDPCLAAAQRSAWNTRSAFWGRTLRKRQEVAQPLHDEPPRRRRLAQHPREFQHDRNGYPVLLPSRRLAAGGRRAPGPARRRGDSARGRWCRARSPAPLPRATRVGADPRVVLLYREGDRLVIGQARRSAPCSRATRASRRAAPLARA